MKLVIPTVQHTGTLFLVGLLKDAGFEVCTFRSKPKTDHSLHYGHCWPGELKYMRPLLRECQAIVPLRHPALVYEAWKRRHRTHLELILQWQTLITEVDKFSPLYLPIDIPFRNAHLKRIGDTLGIDLATDWEPKHSFTDTHWLNPVDVELIEEMEYFHDQPFFHRFYGTRRRGTGESRPPLHDRAIEVIHG